MFTQHRCSMWRKTVASTPMATCESICYPDLLLYHSTNISAASLQPVLSPLESLHTIIHVRSTWCGWECLNFCVCVCVCLFSFLSAVQSCVWLCSVTWTWPEVGLSFKCWRYARVPWVWGMGLHTTNKPKLCLSHCDTHTHTHSHQCMYWQKQAHCVSARLLVVTFNGRVTATA